MMESMPFDDVHSNVKKDKETIVTVCVSIIYSQKDERTGNNELGKASRNRVSMIREVKATREIRVRKRTVAGTAERKR